MKISDEYCETLTGYGFLEKLFGVIHECTLQCPEAILVFLVFFLLNKQVINKSQCFKYYRFALSKNLTMKNRGWMECGLIRTYFISPPIYSNQMSYR